MALVSVYITTCNRIDLLKRCINSILEQTVKDVEIIIVDDNSTDETSSFLEDLTKKNTNIIVLKNQRNMGACHSRNRAIKLATSEYITGCDDDDYFEKDRIEKFLDNKTILEIYPVLFTDSLWKNNDSIKKAGINKFSREIISYNDMIYFNFIGNQIFCKTELLKKHLFDEDMPAWQDFECWFRILKKENCVAKKIKSYNYVQDIGHGQERISNDKLRKVNKAYELFVEKHNFDDNEKRLLRNHFFNYGIGKGFIFKSSVELVKKPNLFKILLIIRNIKEFYKNG